MQAPGWQQLHAHGRFQPILLPTFPVCPVPGVPSQPSWGAACSTGPDPAQIPLGPGREDRVLSWSRAHPPASLPSQPISPLPEAPKKQARSSSQPPAPPAPRGNRRPGTLSPGQQVPVPGGGGRDHISHLPLHLKNPQEDFPGPPVPILFSSSYYGVNGTG